MAAFMLHSRAEWWRKMLCDLQSLKYLLHIYLQKKCWLQLYWMINKVGEMKLRHASNHMSELGSDSLEACQQAPERAWKQTLQFQSGLQMTRAPANRLTTISWETLSQRHPLSCTWVPDPQKQWDNKWGNLLHSNRYNTIISILAGLTLSR